MPAGLEIRRAETKGEGWLIFHTASDKWLDWFAIYHNAVSAVEELGTLGDWTKSASYIRRHISKKRAKAILNKWQF